MAIADAVRSQAIPPFAGQCARPARGPRLLDRDRRPRLGRSPLAPLAGFAEVASPVWIAASAGETEICGQRLSAAHAANESRIRPKRLSRLTAAAIRRGNVLLFCGGGNHAERRGLPGGAEGIRTSDFRGAGPRSPDGAPPPILQGLIAKGRRRAGACSANTMSPPFRLLDLSRRPRRFNDDRPLGRAPSGALL
jgi:hypothetical protein